MASPLDVHSMHFVQPTHAYNEISRLNTIDLFLCRVFVLLAIADQPSLRETDILSDILLSQTYE